MITATEQSNERDDVNRCDWVGCLEVGFFDGAQKTLLNAEGEKNVRAMRRRFVYLCPEHFKLAIGTSTA